MQGPTGPLTTEFGFFIEQNSIQSFTGGYPWPFPVTMFRKSDEGPIVAGDYSNLSLCPIKKVRSSSLTIIPSETDDAIILSGSLTIVMGSGQPDPQEIVETEGQYCVLMPHPRVFVTSTPSDDELPIGTAYIQKFNVEGFQTNQISVRIATLAF